MTRPDTSRGPLPSPLFLDPTPSRFNLIATRWSLAMLAVMFGGCAVIWGLS